MNIVLSVDALSPRLSGIGRYTWELASGLSKHKAINEVAFYRNGCWVRDPSILLLDQKVKLRKNKLLPTWLNQVIVKHQAKGRIFHGPNYFVPACADIGVMTIHDLSVFKFPETHPVERIRQFERDFSSSVSRASHLITDSETTRLEVIEFLGWAPDKITAVALGVSKRFRPSTPHELKGILASYKLIPGGYTLCISTLEPRKKIDALIKAYQRLPNQLRQAYPLVIVGGKGWLSDDLHTLIEDVSTEGWLHYLGFVLESDLPQLYAGARLFVYPSQYEGFGLPLLESMASGVPVITSTYSCLPETADGAALLVNTSDDIQFSQVLEQGLCDEILRNRQIQLGLEVASRRTWQSCVDNTCDVYQKILS